MTSEYERGRSLGYHEGRASLYAELEAAYRRGLEHGLTAASAQRRADEPLTTTLRNMEAQT